MFRSHAFSLLAARTARCGILAVALLYFGPSACAAAPLAERLESAKVVREFSTEGAEIYDVAVGKGLVAFVLWKEDTSVVVVYDHSGNEKFRYGGRDPDTAYHQLRTVDFSEDGGTLMITEVAGIESFRWKVFDLSGHLLFEIAPPYGTEVVASPSGQYFTFSNNFSPQNVLPIYDRAGREIERFENLYPRWTCCFVDDEHLLVAARDTARIIDVGSRRITGVLPLNLPGQGYAPAVALSRPQSVMAVYCSHLLVVLSAAGEELWRESYPDNLLLHAVLFSSDGPWMAMEFHSRDPEDFYYRVTSVRDRQRTVRSQTVAALVKSLFRGSGNCGHFCDGMITVPGQDGLRSATVFLEFESGSRSLGQAAVVQGQYLWFGGPPNGVRYLRATPKGPAQIVEVSAADGR